MKLKNLSIGIAAGLAFTASFGWQTFTSTTASAAILQPATSKAIAQQRNKTRIKLNSEFQLKINQVAHLNPDKLKIRFLRVVEDSRCPANARCITAGKVSIAVKIVQNNRDLGEFILTSNPADPKSAAQMFGENYTINLVDVQPPRMTSETIKPSDYKVILMVSKSSS